MSSCLGALRDGAQGGGMNGKASAGLEGLTVGSRLACALCYCLLHEPSLALDLDFCGLREQP